MPGAVGSFRSGKGGRLSFGGTFIKMQKWSVHDTGIRLLTTNFESWSDLYGDTGDLAGRSFSQALTGPETATSSVEGDWDAGQNPYDDPPGIYTRDDGPEVLLIPNRVDDNHWDFFATRVGESTNDCDTNGLVTFKFQFENQGPYERPTGSF